VFQINNPLKQIKNISTLSSLNSRRITIPSSHDSIHIIQKNINKLHTYKKILLIKMLHLNITLGLEMNRLRLGAGNPMHKTIVIPE